MSRRKQSKWSAIVRENCNLSQVEVENVHFQSVKRKSGQQNGVW